MSRLGYWIALVLASVLVSSVAAWASRTGGTRRLWLATLGSATVLVLVGIADWVRLPTKETRLAVYLAAAIIPSLLTALTVQWLRPRGATYIGQVVGGAFVWLVVAVGTLLLSFFS